MPRMDQAAMPTLDSHRARRDSDAVRASQASPRFNRSTTLGQRPFGVAVPSAETGRPVPITTTPGSSRAS